MTRLRLLPRSDELGWTPYVWLLYILPFAAGPLLSNGGARSWTLTAVGLAVFLILYFRGFWVRGASLLVVIVLMVLLAVIFTPVNPGAAGMFIFAAGFAAGMRSPRQGVWLIAAIVLVILIEALVVGLAVWVWVPAVVFSIAIGAVNIHAGERSRANAKLRAANEQIEHLARIAERERIGRDLHDLLGHTLSVVVLKAELARKLLDRDSARAASEIAEVEKIARDALSEVREAVRGYRTAGLSSEVRRSVAVLENAGIRVDHTVEELSLDPAVEVMFELALREAVTNVLRHANAARVEIHFGQRDEMATLMVRDDGTAVDFTEGMGLRGMRQRANEVGASLTIGRDRGFEVRLQVPLTRPA